MNKLVAPTGVAVIGASEELYYARNVLHNLLVGGYPPERIFPVHPTHATVAGLRCYPGVDAIAAPVSLAVVATRASVVPTVVEEAGRAGVGSAIVFADGYAEQGPTGRQRQLELAKTAERAGVAIMGPNTMGFLAPGEGVLAWGSGRFGDGLKAGGIGLVFQSSGMLNLAVSLAIQYGLGIRSAFSVGNEVGYDAADFIAYLAGDPGTTVIGCLIEGTGRPRRLVQALQKAREVGKPVVMLKLGRSERARRSAVAHTGRMVSSGQAWQAMLSRLGVVQVRDLDELMNTVSVFDRYAQRLLDRCPARTAGVAMMTISGGDCGLLSDLAEDFGTPLAELSPDTLAELRRIFGKPDLVGNPLDCENLHQEDFERFAQGVEALVEDPSVDVLVARMNLPTAPSDSARRLYAHLAETVRRRRRLLVVVSRANESLSTEWNGFFDELGVPFLRSYSPAVRAVSRLARWTETRAAWSPVEAAIVPSSTREMDAPRIATWAEAQEVLAAASVPYARAYVLADGDLPPDEQSMSFPVAAKLVSTALAHKSDVDGVRLGIGDVTELASAVRELRSTAAERGIPLEGIEVQEMTDGAVEVAVGITYDSSLGPMLVLGIGGIFTELLHDVAMTPLPVTPSDVDLLLGSLRAAPVLKGYRRLPPADVAALTEVLVSLSRYGAAHASDLIGLECNPVIVGREGQGVRAVDVLVLLAR